MFVRSAWASNVRLSKRVCNSDVRSSKPDTASHVCTSKPVYTSNFNTKQPIGCFVFFSINFALSVKYAENFINFLYYYLEISV